MFRSFVPCFAPAIKTNKMFASRNAKSLGFNLVVTRPPMLHPSWRASHMLWSLTRMPPLRHIDTFSPSRTSIKYDAKSDLFPFSNWKRYPKSLNTLQIHCSMLSEVSRFSSEKARSGFRCPHIILAHHLNQSVPLHVAAFPDRPHVGPRSAWGANQQQMESPGERQNSW